MIRFKRLPLDLLDAWLVAGVPVAPVATYRLRSWSEDRSAIVGLKADLLAYIAEAFDDTRHRLRLGFEDNLSSFNDPATDPAANFPAVLHRVSLQGYLGEMLAVLAVEHWGAHGHDDWIAPAFLFRLHEAELQHLEAINERLLAGETYDPDRIAERRPGRTGDDGIAFRLNGSNVITDVLTLEAKCLSLHNNGKIGDAYTKLAQGGLRPSGIRELVNILDDYDTPLAQRWQQALLELWSDGYRTVARSDAVAYACVQTPAHPSRKTWMPARAPGAGYTATRQLEAMEFHLHELHLLVDIIFRGA